jgi:hypothetical protein
MKTKELELSEKIERRREMIHIHIKRENPIREVIKEFDVCLDTYYYRYHRYVEKGIFGLFDLETSQRDSERCMGKPASFVLRDAEAKPLTNEELEGVIRKLYFENVERKVKQNGKVEFKGKEYHEGRKMLDETVEVLVTLKRVKVWHNGTFIKRWRYWEYVLGIAVGYMMKKYLL